MTNIIDEFIDKADKLFEYSTDGKACYVKLLSILMSRKYNLPMANYYFNTKTSAYESEGKEIAVDDAFYSTGIRNNWEYPKEVFKYLNLFDVDYEDSSIFIVEPIYDENDEEIDPDDIDKLFDAFNKLSESEKINSVGFCDGGDSSVIYFPSIKEEVLQNMQYDPYLEDTSLGALVLESKRIANFLKADLPASDELVSEGRSRLEKMKISPFFEYDGVGTSSTSSGSGFLGNNYTFAFINLKNDYYNEVDYSRLDFKWLVNAIEFEQLLTKIEAKYGLLTKEE